MILNIVVGIMFVIVIAAGFWGWWIDNGGTFGKEKENEKENCKEEEKKDEKN